MKNMKKMFALLLAMVMVLGMSTLTAFAAGTGSITITPPSGVDADGTNTYKIYKVFDADGNGTNISYKLVSGKTKAPAGFTVDAAGNVTLSRTTGDLTQLTAAEIAAIAEYVKDDTEVATATSEGSANAVAANLPNGYYYITTTTGSVVTITTTNPSATVNDKNTVPVVDKKITGASSLDEDGKKALAQVGTDVTYTVDITVGKGAVGYVFHDIMSAGLSYNNDVVVKLGDTVVGTDKYSTATAAGDTLTISFDDDYIKTLAAGTKLNIIYSAKVTSDALTMDPANNTATIDYGNGYSSTSTSVEVYNAKFTVTKKDGNNKALAGAGFVLKNAAGKYYNLTNNVVTWVDNIANATEYTSDANGAVTAFTGLANGTYTLVEKTVPAGYNKAADSTFTIEARNYTQQNLEQASTVINNAGTQLPSTGGMGTTLFYVVGGILVLAAGIMLVARKRMSSR